MRISIFGLGYVGAVCAGCLSARGHDVIGVDVAKDKIDMINAGKSPIVEPGLGELLAKGIETGRLRGTTNFAEAIRDTDLSMICVGTPSKKNGDHVSVDHPLQVLHQPGPSPIVAYVDASGWLDYQGGIYPASACSSDGTALTHVVQIVGRGSENGVDFWLVR